VSELLGKFIWWLNQYAAAVQAISTSVALPIAIFVPWWQQRQNRKSVFEQQQTEISALRFALREEVMMHGKQCSEAACLWETFETFNPRSAALPPLTIYEANASKVGLLMRGEIIPLIAFAGTLADLRNLVNDIQRRKVVLVDPNERSMVMRMLKQGRKHADEFVIAVSKKPVKSDPRYEMYLRELNNQSQD
jgi:hypothetical protein